jgi:hypothetical protein
MARSIFRLPAASFLLDALERRLLLTQTYAFTNAPITGGGFVDGIEFSPAQQNLIYARTDVGGGYRWNAATNSWIPLNDSFGRADSQLTGVLSLAPDPSNANDVYEAVGQYTESFGEDAAILYSTNQGATWGRTNLPFRLGGNDDGRGAGERLQVDPNKGSILFLGTNNNGLWKSTDSGHTWAQVTTFPAAASSLTFVLFDKRSATAGNATQTIYVGVNALTGTNLYRSTDGGTTWAAVPGEPTGMLAFHAALDSAGSLYVTYDNNLGPNNVTTGAVDRLNTTTGAWTVITPPTGQGGFAGVSVDPSTPGTLLVTTTDRWYPHDQIYRSTTSGAQWTSLWATNTVFDNSAAPWVNLTPSWLDAVAIDPFNSNHAMFGTGFGLYSSVNIKSNPITWSFTDNGLEETFPLALIAPSSGVPLGVAVGDIDGFQFASVTTVPSTRFTANFGTNDSLDFAENDPSKWVRTFNGSTDGAYSTNDGVTWTTFASTPPTISAGPGNIAISADGNTLVWMPTDSAAYYSTNNGATWTLSTGGPSNASNTFTPIADRANPSAFTSTITRWARSTSAPTAASPSPPPPPNSPPAAARPTPSPALPTTSGFPPAAVSITPPPAAPPSLNSPAFRPLIRSGSAKPPPATLIPPFICGARSAASSVFTVPMTPAPPGRASTMPTISSDSSTRSSAIPMCTAEFTSPPAAAASSSAMSSMPRPPSPLARPVLPLPSPA